MKRSLYDLELGELKEITKPSFRAKQIFDWIYKKYAFNYIDMKNIPKELKATLEESFIINPLEIAKKEISSDGSVKYLFQLQDKHTIESVLLKMKEKKTDENGKIIASEKFTICLSTQVGCKVGCAFCLTAKGGFVRNLSAGEIVAQVVNIKKDLNLPEEKSLNLVYMGMGEPLDNFENFVKAVKILSDEHGLMISRKRQTISTSGISSKINKLAQANLGINLAISLHAVDDELRSELIPMNKAYNIQSIIDAVKKFPTDSRKKVLFEYLVIKDKNDDIASAKKLVKLLNGVKAKVNLIYFNPYEGSLYKRPSKDNLIKFQEFLLSKGLLCTIRESKGLDISAACGQLREKDMNGCN